MAGIDLTADQLLHLTCSGAPVRKTVWLLCLAHRRRHSEGVSADGSDINHLRAELSTFGAAVRDTITTDDSGADGHAGAACTAAVTRECSPSTWKAAVEAGAAPT